MAPLQILVNVMKKNKACGSRRRRVSQAGSQGSFPVDVTLEERTV